jgi:hypothetical protein
VGERLHVEPRRELATNDALVISIEVPRTRSTSRLSKKKPTAVEIRSR